MNPSKDITSWFLEENAEAQAAADVGSLLGTAAEAPSQPLMSAPPSPLAHGEPSPSPFSDHRQRPTGAPRQQQPPPGAAGRGQALPEANNTVSTLPMQQPADHSGAPPHTTILGFAGATRSSSLDQPTLYQQQPGPPALPPPATPSGSLLHPPQRLPAASASAGPPGFSLQQDLKAEQRSPSQSLQAGASSAAALQLQQGPQEAAPDFLALAADSPPLVPSTMTNHIAHPCAEEEVELQILAANQRHLARLLKSTHAHGSDRSRRKYAEAVAQLQRLVGELEAAVAEHQHIQRRGRLARMQLALDEVHQRWMELDAAAGGGRRRPRLALPAEGDALLVTQARMLAPAAAAADPLGASGAVPSVFELPAGPGAWDLSWDARVRQLQTRDVLLLHRQFLQRCAMLLPKVQAPGLRGTPAAAGAARELEQLHSSYNCYSQRLMRLAPAAWRDSLHYSLDTLERLDITPDFQYFERYRTTDFWTQEDLQALNQVRAQFRKALDALDAELRQLRQRFEQLTAESGASEADEVLKLIQAKLAQQEMVQQHHIFAVINTVPLDVVARMRLVLYPLAINGQSVNE